MTTSATRTPRRALVALLAVLVALSLAGCSTADRSTGQSASDPTTPGATSSSGPAGDDPTDPVTDAPTDPSQTVPEDGDGDLIEVQGDSVVRRPRSVRIPSLGITSSLDRLAVVSDGTLERPPEWDVAGWYAQGPKPGETGPAVIAGHVDSPTGPAVFTGLDALAPGDEIEVDDVDGTTLTFVVDRLASAPKDSFPTEAVYGQTPDSELRLITCSGAYVSDRGGYQDNLIVYATMAS